MIILPANTLSTGGYEVANSCRFNDGDSAYMSKTSGSGDRRQFTISAWVKRGALGTEQQIYGSGNSATNVFTVFFDGSTDRLSVTDYQSGGTLTLTTNRVFRDVSAWYHVCVAIDTDQGTASNRAKLYVNGTQETSFSTENYPSQNTDLYVNISGQPHNVGVDQGPGRYFDGYMAEVVFIDGTQNAVTDFGEFDEDSPTIWKPKDVSGLTFGTNGFYLDFEDSANLGNDANGGTDLTETNLAATDQATDTPTNNFATLNPLFRSRYDNDTAFSEGNLKASWSSSADRGYGMSSIGVTSGKWYCEVKAVNRARLYLGVGDGNFLAGQSVPIWQPNPSNGIAIAVNTGNMEYNGSTENTSYGTGASDNDIIQIALDMDNHLLWFGVNGTWMNSATESEIENSTSTNDVTTAIGTQNIINNGEPINILAIDGSTSGTSDAEFNFGSPPYTITSGNADDNGYGNFEYSVPSGYYALCTKNLAEFG